MSEKSSSLSQSESQENMAAKELKAGSQNLMKYLSLVTLTVQNAALALTMRQSRIQKGEMFLASTAVLVTEVVKLICCTLMIFMEEGFSFVKTAKNIHMHTIANPLDTLKVALPSIVYYIQNNLLYVGISHVDAATFQVTYQMKILTTAVLSVFMLNKKLVAHQWVSLFLLFCGVSLVQLVQINSNSNSENSTHQNPLIGLGAILIACCLSGFAGVYFEKILKGSSVSVWVRNIQLSCIAIPFGIMGLVLSDFSAVQAKGFFSGYNYLTWSVILLQAMGGLLVAVVVKYADNILKGFATSLAIIVGSFISSYFFTLQITFQFMGGTFLVMISTFLYSYQKPNVSKSFKPQLNRSIA